MFQSSIMQDNKQDIRPLIEMVAVQIKEKAIRMAPVDLGDLRRKIDYRIEDNTLIIFCTAPEAKDMEYGKAPEPLDKNEKDDIDAWAKRHGLKDGKGVARSIEKRGIKVGTTKAPLHITSFGRDSYRPFLRPAIYQILSKINRII